MKRQKTVVVIGGGLGGLSAAISLAQKGYAVSLYEKNHHLGGKLNRLEQDGFGFDLGPSILTMPHIFEKLFAESGYKMKDFIPTIRLDHEWRSFFPDDTILDLYNDLNKMLAENDLLNANDMKEYQDFLSYAKRLYEYTEEGYFQKGLDSAKDVIQHHGVVDSIKGFDLFSTMSHGIEKRISNPKLRTMLSYFIKYVGSSPYDAPAVLNMLVYMQHAQGVWYVPGGMDLIADGLERLAKKEGVQFFTGTAVKKLEKTDGKQISKAILEDGTSVEADYFVSNMEVIPAYDKLLGESAEYIHKLEKKYQPSSSGLVLHLGVKRLYPQLAHHNFFFSENLQEQMNRIFHEHRLPDDPTIYLVNVNKTDPLQTIPGHENLKVLPHIPYIQDEPFTKEEYLDFRDVVLDKLERMGLKGLRHHIVTEDMWTPHDIENMYWSHRGSIYGTLSDKKLNRGFKHPKQSEKYDNLYFVGGTVNPGGGMPMVTLSGQQVSELIVTRDQQDKQSS
ncbi:phytoene desaturase [Virgibacillus halodenitrificans]|uniref:phytoene desaturase family protein n=1 Tax=Virgibacillus halodenitrificans TaxID=1482 RepID=UPI0013687E8C|nr:NAD(P)/FAD-dependent oxidoreductase [Virgibacillus halodenitrificans]MYL47528.1 phytoene desaturase [Virgibacillus halodenitrificans]